MCGEKPADYVGYKLAQGSPPHVRGKVFSICSFWRCVGITPACAGKRESPYYMQIPYEDHPRMCGEKDARSEN